MLKSLSVEALTARRLRFSVYVGAWSFCRCREPRVHGENRKWLLKCVCSYNQTNKIMLKSQCLKLLTHIILNVACFQMRWKDQESPAHRLRTERTSCIFSVIGWKKAAVYPCAFGHKLTHHMPTGKQHTFRGVLRKNKPTKTHCSLSQAQCIHRSCGKSHWRLGF